MVGNHPPKIKEEFARDTIGKILLDIALRFSIMDLPSFSPSEWVNVYANTYQVEIYKTYIK